MRALGRGALLVVCASLPFVSAGCGSSPARWSARWDAPYARFGDEARAAFVDARVALDAGRRMEALERLRALRDQQPGNLEVAAWLQDVEEDLLLDGVDLFAPENSLVGTSPATVLQRHYRGRPGAGTVGERTAVGLVLSARAEEDDRAARSQLEAAIDLDPRCAWAHYGLSHVLLRDREAINRWALASASLERALELDPGNLRARRLEAWMLGEEGSRDEAEGQLRRWIDIADEDPRVSATELTDARLDLARLLLLRGEAPRAKRILADLEGTAWGRNRRLTLMAVALQEDGAHAEALEYALRAQWADEAGLLPLVQEALLHELFLGDRATAVERWREISGRSQDSASLADLVQALRARVRIEREEGAQEAP